MASLSCTTKSIKLASGESFVLPPGAKIVGATDKTLLTSKNDCADLEKLEDIACYICAIPIAGEDGGDEQYWEAYPGVNACTPGLKGYILNQENIVNFINGGHSNITGAYWFTDPGFLVGTTTFKTELMNLIPGIIEVKFGSKSDIDTGCLNYILIQTIPSIAENLELVVQVYADPSPGDALGYFKFQPLADFNGYSGVPTCPTTAQS